jgi:archaetidylinositol phosphate synthase
MRRLVIFLLTPVAARLEGVNPNTLTFMATVAGLLAGVAYVLTRQHIAFYFIAGTLVAISGICDGLDGLVARRTGRTSKVGDFLDHFGDRLVDVAIFTGMAFMPGVLTPLALCVVILSLLHGYLGTQIHASFGERYYGGAGKTELFVALVLLTPLLAFAPGFSLPFGPPGAGNAVFMVTGIIIAASFLHRMSHALKLVRRESERG